MVRDDKWAMQFALTVAELAFRYAEKGHNLDATLLHVRSVLVEKGAKQ